MSNTWFQFKQFIIHQDKCGMKVSTDACIQGAWAPILPQVKHVLDIGTGTGLLSLMLAQRYKDILIDAIELDEAAAQQAHENIIASPWADRINVMQGDIRTYPFGRKYEMIICNPPFFSNSLQSADDGRNHARHDVTLSQGQLIGLLNNLLNDDGYAVLQFPLPEHDKFEKSLKVNGFGIFNKLFIIPQAGQKPNRILSLCTRNAGATTEVAEIAELSIRTADKNYSPEFIKLLFPFYLSL